MFIILIITLLIFQTSCQITDVIVETDHGRIQGYHKLSFNQRIFSSFEGIPYARPPVGELRFKDPVPLDSWSGVWRADTPSHCLQIGFLFQSSTSGDEDCLHLNVYVPREKPDPSERLDVIVHIHGGAFIIGSGHFYAHPEFLMDHNIVFVTMNYRLGIFGFLSTEDNVIAGNFGLKDQTLALKWIQENIKNFGGNPNSVTITGLSTGGGCVHYHYLSPLSKGLFHRGFSQSGTALGSWAVQEEPLQRTVYLAKKLGCPTDNSQEILNCLQQRTAKQLLNTTHLFFAFDIYPPCAFGPVIEKSSNPFIDKQPYDILINREFHDLPWINSVTSDEGRYFVNFQPDQLKEINENFTDLAPYLLDCVYTLPKTGLNTTTEKIKQQYLNKNQKIDVVDLIGDRYFAVSAEKAAKIQAKMGKSPVYFLYFNYATENNQQKITHTEDAYFFFHNSFESAANLTPNDYKLKDIMVDMLISFAKDNKPRIPEREWPPTKFNETTYLNVSSYKSSGIQIQTRENIFPVSFWDSLGLLENENIVKDEF